MESRYCNKEMAKLDYLQSAVRKLGGGCTLIEQALIKATGKVPCLNTQNRSLVLLIRVHLSQLIHSLTKHICPSCTLKNAGLLRRAIKETQDMKYQEQAIFSVRQNMRSYGCRS